MLFSDIAINSKEIQVRFESDCLQGVGNEMGIVVAGHAVFLIISLIELFLP